MRDELIRLADRLTPIVGIDSCEAKELAQIERELRQLAERPATCNDGLQVVPDGCFLAPLEPSDAMRMAGTSGLSPSDIWLRMARQAQREQQFVELLAAAPKPNHSPDAGNKAPPEGGT
jgi:hypothetical protein